MRRSSHQNPSVPERRFNPKAQNGRSLNYIHADRQNSVTALSDQWGTLLWPRRAYGAYGGEAETRSIGPRRGRTRPLRWRATRSATPAGAGSTSWGSTATGRGGMIPNSGHSSSPTRSAASIMSTSMHTSGSNRAMRRIRRGCLLGAGRGHPAQSQRLRVPVLSLPSRMEAVQKGLQKRFNLRHGRPRLRHPCPAHLRQHQLARCLDQLPSQARYKGLLYESLVPLALP